MKTVRNLKLLLTVIFIALFLMALSISMLVMDFKLSHKTLFTVPFDFLSYNLELNTRKFVRSIVDEGNVGLPQVRLYISESSQQSLMSDIPKSTKKWQKGYILNNKNLQKIKVRHQGDDYFNWILYKKSFKIKTKKDEMFGMNRAYDLLVPESGMFLREYSAKNIANEIGVLSSKVQLVEVFVNDESLGIYIKSEALNESFLRRNGIMPVNLYKGEQNHDELILGLYYDLFNNTSLWSKKSYFNKKSKGNKTDLYRFLSLVRDAETNDIAFEELTRNVDIEKWSTFSAFEILTQSYTSDYRHNQRLVLDPWSGTVYPIAQDSSIADSFFTCNDKFTTPFLLEHSETPREHNLWLLLNRSSKYVDQKYKKLLHYTKIDQVLLKEAKHVNELKPFIEKSYSRDIDSIILHGKSNIVEDIGVFSEALSSFNNCIIDRLDAIPDSTWSTDENGFIISINGEVPVSDIIVDFGESPLPKWIGIDLNGDTFINSNEMITSLRKEGSTISIPVRLYANRVVVAGGGIHRDNDMRRKDIIIANTGFRFVTSNNAKIKSVSASNPFSNKRTILKNKQFNYVLPSRLNVPIINGNYAVFTPENKTVISGVLNITSDQHYKDNVTILPGTVINLDPGVNLIFYNKVTAKGTPELPIIIKRKNLKHAWGVVALQGPNTSGSIFNNINISGGSGSELNGIYYTAMFSLHNTSNILIKNSRLSMNTKYDDMFHVVYGDNITLNNVSFTDSIFDAIDIDMSKGIVLKKIKIVNAGNDAIDFMETEALVDQANLYKSGDKGISAGENSNILIYNSLLRGNAVGIASKDGSNVQVLYSDLDSNKVQMSLYKKNWRYNDGGYAQVSHTRILNGVNNFNIDSHSGVVIKDTDIDGKDNHGEISFGKNNLVFNKITHPLYGHATIVKDGRIRGF